jgi:hypothetical protein
VADRSNTRIQIFDQTGRFLNQWTNFGTPWGLFIRGDLIYVVDGTANNCLLIASTKDGKVLERIEGVSNPTAVTVNSTMLALSTLSCSATCRAAASTRAVGAEDDRQEYSALPATGWAAQTVGSRQHQT